MDRLEEKVTDVQNKIGTVRQWNFHQLTLLEYRERNLETWLIDFMEKKEELKSKADETATSISNISRLERKYKLVYNIPNLKIPKLTAFILKNRKRQILSMIIT